VNTRFHLGDRVVRTYAPGVGTIDAVRALIRDDGQALIQYLISWDDGGQTVHTAATIRPYVLIIDPDEPQEVELTLRAVTTELILRIGMDDVLLDVGELPDQNTSMWGQVWADAVLAWATSDAPNRPLPVL
jgi:hypothetical protein